MALVRGVSFVCLLWCVLGCVVLWLLVDDACVGSVKMSYLIVIKPVNWVFTLFCFESVLCSVFSLWARPGGRAWLCVSVFRCLMFITLDESDLVVRIWFLLVWVILMLVLA